MNSSKQSQQPDPPRPSQLAAPRPNTSLRSISLVTALTFFQLVLQFATQLVLAKVFGAASEMDAFVAALALPVVVAMVLSASLGYVLVPVVAESLAAGGPRAAAAVTSQIGLYLVGLSLLIAISVAAAARPLAGLFCPGFSGSERELTMGLLRILSAIVFVNSLVAFLNALFHAYRRFAEPAAAGVIGTLATLVYVVVLHDRQGIFAVAWGVVVGAATTATLLLPLFISQLRQSAAWKNLRLHPATRQCLSLLAPLVLGAIGWRLDPLLDRFLGSYLPAGSIAHIGYAARLITGLALIGTSGLSIVSFPAIAAHAAARRPIELNVELAHALRFLIVLLAPVCIGVASFATPVVRLLFERGRFTAADTQAVAGLVVLYLGVIVGGGLGDLLSRTFYAQHDMRTPVLISAAVFACAAALKFVLVGPWQAAGLVAATSFYYLANAGVLTGVLLARLSRDMLAGTAWALARSVVCSICACAAASVVMRWPATAAVLPAAACGAAVYILLMWLLGDEFARRMLRRPSSR